MPVEIRMLESWERQEGESILAYEAFSVYRDMGAERGVRAVGQRLGKSRAQIEKWSVLWHWVERVYAYDLDLDRKVTAQSEETHLQQIRDYRSRCQRAAAVASEASILLLDASVKRLQAMNPLTIAPGELAGLIRAAAQVLALSATMEAEALSLDRIEAILKERDRDPTNTP